MKKYLLFFFAFVAFPQTVDWSQIKTADRLGAGTMGQSTSVGIASAKPLTCVTGQQYFATDASAGSNLYLCSATNTWTQLVFSAGSATIFALSGTSLTQRPTFNFIPSGTAITCLDNAGQNRTDCTFSYNTAVIQTIASNQSGVPSFCNSTNGTQNYTCTFVGSGSAALLAYTKGMRVYLSVDTTSSSSSVLNIDGLGNISLKRSDCATGVGTDVAIGSMLEFWYNGSVFCEVLPTH